MAQMAQTILFRLIFCAGLLVLMVTGLHSALGMSGDNPEVGYFSTFLVLGTLTLATCGFPRTSYSAAALTAGVGLLIIWLNHTLNLVYGYDWFEGLWYFTPDWIRYITYALVGFVLGKKWNARGAVVGIAVLALLDSVLGWLALLPTQLSEITVTSPGNKHSFVIFNYDWEDAGYIAHYLLARIVLWWGAGLIGAFLARSNFPKRLKIIRRKEQRIPQEL